MCGTLTFRMSMQCWESTRVVIKIQRSYLIRFYIYLILIFYCTLGVGEKSRAFIVVSAVRYF